MAAWENALATIVQSIKASRVAKSTDWLVYHKGPGEYFVVLNRPELAQTIAPSDMEEVAGVSSSQSEFSQALTTLRILDVAVTGDAIWHQQLDLSTAEEMRTATNPLAIVTEYSVTPLERVGFEESMRDYMAFLKAMRYPYPIEGFHGVVGRPQRFMSVTFPETWVEYHAGKDARSFAASRNLAARQSELVDRITRAVTSIREIRLEYAPDLSL